MVKYNYIQVTHVLSQEIVSHELSFDLFNKVYVIKDHQLVLDEISMTLNMNYLMILLALLVLTIILPGLVAAFYMIRQSSEDELKALF